MTTTTTKTASPAAIPSSYEAYWNMVLGPKSAETIVYEYDLVPAGLDSFREWVGEAESMAKGVGGNFRDAEGWAERAAKELHAAAQEMNLIKTITCLDGSIVTVRELPEGFAVLRRHDAAGCPDTVFAGPFKDATPATNGTWSKALSLALDMATDLARRVNTELRAQWNAARSVPAPKSMQEGVAHA